MRYLCRPGEEYLPFCAVLEGLRPVVEPVRVTWVWCGDVAPLEVIEVYLPLILARRPCGEVTTLDIRRQRLARVPGKTARRAVRRLAGNTSRKKRKRKRRCRR